MHCAEVDGDALEDDCARRGREVTATAEEALPWLPE